MKATVIDVSYDFLVSSIDLSDRCENKLFHKLQGNFDFVHILTHEKRNKIYIQNIIDFVVSFLNDKNSNAKVFCTITDFNWEELGINYPHITSYNGVPIIPAGFAWNSYRLHKLENHAVHSSWDSSNTEILALPGLRRPNRLIELKNLIDTNLPIKWSYKLPDDFLDVNGPFLSAKPDHTTVEEWIEIGKSMERVLDNSDFCSDTWNFFGSKDIYNNVLFRYCFETYPNLGFTEKTYGCILNGCPIVHNGAIDKGLIPENYLGFQFHQLTREHYSIEDMYDLHKSNPKLIRSYIEHNRNRLIEIYNKTETLIKECIGVSINDDYFYKVFCRWKSVYANTLGGPPVRELHIMEID